MDKTLTRCMKQAMTCWKDLWIIRHGQATHNPRAEAARAAGCSFDEFLELMRQDDSLDSELTPLGVEQAKTVHATYRHVLAASTPAFDLVVASPLSRAIHTADLAVPPAMAQNRIVQESFREINGWLLNAKRRTKTELSRKFPYWSFDLLSSEEDIHWTETVETNESSRDRGYHGFSWILRRPEQRVLLVAHGGILRQTMGEFPEKIVMADERTTQTERCIKARFDNCEVRRYRLEWEEGHAQEAGKLLFTEIDITST